MGPGGRRLGLALALSAAILGAAACSSTPEPSGIPSLQPVALTGAGVGVARATLAEAIVPHIGDSPDGPMMRTEPDGLPLALDPGRRVVLLGAPRAGPGGPWVRVWVEPSLEVWPGDFYAWLPTTRDGRDVLRPIDPATCPTEATIQTLARLVQQDRLRCAGGAVVTIDARTGPLPAAPLYDVNPAWYGRNADPVVTMFDPGPARFGPDATTTPDRAGSWIEARVPPDVPPLPLGLYLRVTGRFDDPTAVTCTRRILNAVLDKGPPNEGPADSVQWCREQFVVSSWQGLLGAEGRPLDPNDPQLHRREFRVPPGVLSGCGGVGMPLLTIRIDPRQLDPVWVEVAGGGRSMPVFSSEFRLLLDPLRIQATNGVTLVDGEPLDPDRGKPGLALCPGGATIWFDVAPGR